MGDTLQKRIHTLVTQVFAARQGAWLVWCDPDGHWLPLLKRVAADRRMGELLPVEVDEKAAGAYGGPVTRRDLQQRLDAHASFVLYVPAVPEALGWLWGQALLAERIYDTSLRSQLVAWGWRPHNLTVGDGEVAALALANLQQDPTEWGAGGLQPDPNRLLEVLAALREPDAETRLILDLTAEQMGLPTIDDEDLADWRRRCLALLLVTQAHIVVPSLVPQTHERVIATHARSLALTLLDDWVDSHRLAASLPTAISAADAVAGLASLLTLAAAADGPFVSYAAEKLCFANTCRRLADLDGRALLESLAALGPEIERHRDGLWGRRMDGRASWAIPWGELGRLSAAARDLLTSSPVRGWATPQDAVDWYVGGGWRMDSAGEEIERGLDVTTPELTALIAPLRRAYRARWEESAISWSECWVQAGCPLPARLHSAEMWLLAALEASPEASPEPTVVLTVDALRFDLGAELVRTLNHQEGVERARVEAARAPLPSITALGMGAALPIPETQLEADLVGDQWQLRRTGIADNLSSAQARRAWWTQQPRTVVADGLSSLLSGEIPAPQANLRRLIVYDGAIDRQGHDKFLLQGSKSIIKRYLDAIEHLRDHGWRRILVVTDHGFIHWAGTQEHHVAFPQPNPVYRSRRAAAYPSATALEGAQAQAPGGKWKIGFPRGAACFQTYGGLGYFHGGASLQEWIIPCIAVTWPQTAAPVGVTVDPIARILSQRPKVTLTISTERLLPEDNIPRQVEVIVRHAATHAILFRSRTSVTASGEEAQIEVIVETVAGASADRNTPLLIQARDPRTEMPIAETTSTLMIELGGW